jgi:hypothetical protein
MEDEKIGESIYIDLPLKGVDQIKFEEKLKNLGLKKPSPYPPSIERDAFKALGFDCDILKKKYITSILQYLNSYVPYNPKKFNYTAKNVYFNINGNLVEDAKKFIKTKNTSYFPNCPEELLTKFFNDLIKYINFANDHEKTKKYLKDREDYYNTIEKYKREFNFLYSPYNSTGYLLTLLNIKTNKIFYFLVGTKQKVSDSFYNWQDFRVLKAKKVISNDELTGMLIFE